MTISKRWLRKLCESLWLSCSREQERIILARFRTEPLPYQWTEQDIVVQIENYLGCGEFVKSIQNTGGLPIDPDYDDDFF